MAIRILLENLSNGLRLAFFRRVNEDRLVVTWWQIAVLGILSVIFPVLYDIASTGGSGRIELAYLPAAIAHLPIFLFTAIIVGYLVGTDDTPLVLLQTFLMVAVAIDLVVYTIYFAAEELPLRLPHVAGEAYYILPIVWLAAASAKATTRISSVSVVRATFAAAVCAFLLALPLIQMSREGGLWQEDIDDNKLASAAEHKGLDEDVFYEQPKILERELAAVQPGRAGVVDVYFIGVGGYVNQDVFMKEVDAVGALFRERFGSEGKIVRLVNNRKSAARLPIASVTGLGAALNRVGEVMDKDEDILFLFLTSHGSETHRFSLDFWPLNLKELDPPKLRALLDESGIKNRVVVVSACYSGGFIQPLKNENTLVISASAADKNSFGCSNEAEWTYFGKAYFDEALRKTFSFVEAFEIAKPVIAEREKKDGHKPSDPQMALGQGIKPKLLTLQRQLAQQQEQR